MKRISSYLFLAISFPLSLIFISCSSTENKKAPKTEQELSEQIKNSFLDSINKSNSVFDANNLIGKWSVSEFFDEKRSRDMMQLDATDKATVTLTGKTSYFEGGTSNAEGEMEIKIIGENSSESLTLKFDFEITSSDGYARIIKL